MFTGNITEAKMSQGRINVYPKHISAVLFSLRSIELLKIMTALTNNFDMDLGSATSNPLQPVWWNYDLYSISMSKDFFCKVLVTLRNPSMIFHEDVSSMLEKKVLDVITGLNYSVKSEIRVLVLSFHCDNAEIYTFVFVGFCIR